MHCVGKYGHPCHARFFWPQQTYVTACSGIVHKVWAECHGTCVCRPNLRDPGRVSPILNPIQLSNGVHLHGALAVRNLAFMLPTASPGALAQHENGR